MQKYPSSFRNSLVIFGMAIFLFSCNKTSEEVKHIPKDANVVLAFDVKSIGFKSLDFKEFFSLESLKNKFNKASAKDSTIANLKNSGIDLLSTAYFFSQVNEDAKGYGALTVSLSDAGKFEAFAKELDKNFSIVEEGEFKFASKAGEQSIIGWNKNMAIFLFETTEGTNPKEKVLSFFNLKKEESLLESDKTFNELLKESADISVWVNFEKFGKMASQFSMGTPSLNLKETFLTATCNFEKGQVVIDSKYHVNKETAGKLSLTKNSLSKEITNVVAGKSVLALIGISLDMDKIYNYLEKEKLVSDVDQGAQMTGLTSKELFQMLSGELVATINGIEMQEVDEMDAMTGELKKNKVPKPEYSVVIGINDKAKAAMLLTKLSDMGLVKMDNYYSYRDELFLVDKGSYLVVAGSESMRKLAIDGNGEKLNSDLSSLLTENAGSIYLNFNSIPEVFLNTLGPKANEYLKNSQLEAITITGSSIKDNISKGKVVIAFKQKEENSLVIMAKASEKFAEEIEETDSVLPEMESGTEMLEGADLEGKGLKENAE